MPPILNLVIDRTCMQAPLAECVSQVVAAGVDWVQIRERALEGAPLLALAREIAEAARAGSRPARVIVNKRIDIALAIAADGVHLGGDALSVSEARNLLGENAVIGVSSHATADVQAAAAAHANYAHLAPIHDPKSKPATRPALGLQAIEEAARFGLPVLAQGGVEASHCRALLAAGAAGVAVTGTILLADDPVAATEALREALDRV